MAVSFVYVTAGDVAEARRIGRTVVEERLAACANIVPGVQSVYWWEGQIEESSEAALILKTTGARLEALVERVRELHSYDCPCIEALAVVGGNAAFLDWVERETSGG
jgi:periplasmic divalent cation tolerance protein